MIIVTFTYTRPEKNIPLFSAPADLKQEFLEKYRYTGKSISTKVAYSPDGLTAVVTNTWNSHADLDEFRIDPLSNNTRSLRDAYVISNNLQLVVDINDESSASNQTTTGQ
jgi:hypothetical protein